MFTPPLTSCQSCCCFVHYQWEARGAS